MRTRTPDGRTAVRNVSSARAPPARPITAAATRTAASVPARARHSSATVRIRCAETSRPTLLGFPAGPAATPSTSPATVDTATRVAVPPMSAPRSSVGAADSVTLLLVPGWSDVSQITVMLQFCAISGSDTAQPQNMCLGVSQLRAMLAPSSPGSENSPVRAHSHGSTTSHVRLGAPVTKGTHLDDDRQKAPPAATVPEVRAGGRGDHAAGRIARFLRGERWRRRTRHPGTAAASADNPFGVAANSAVDAVIFNGGYGIDYVEFAAKRCRPSTRA